MSVPSPNRNLITALLVLILLCLLPVPARLMSWLSGVTWQLLVPVTEPLTRISTAIRPQPGPFAENDPAVRSLKITIAELQTRNAQLENENGILQSELYALREMAKVIRRDEFRPLRVQRAGSAPASQSGIFLVNAGSTYGVEVGTVVIVPPTQLVGIVSNVSPLTAAVIPITSAGFDLLEVRIDRPDLAFPDDPAGTLQPDGEGTLTGLFETALLEQVGVAVGDHVRLDDSRIGLGHTGLLVGVIDRIEPNDANPLHQRLFVKPLVDPERQPAYYLLVRRHNRNINSSTLENPYGSE